MCSSPKNSGANNALNRTLGIALVLLVTFADLQAASSNADVTAINKLQKQVDDAIVAGDTERYVALLVDDAVLMPPNALPVVGREAIRSWNEGMARRFRIQRYVPLDDELVVAGDWAFRRATFTWSVMSTTDGNSLNDSGKFIIIYQRVPDGSWKVARDIWNSNAKEPLVR
jgi:ketosteroid isomerase-like protein